MSETLTWVSDPERDDWIFGVREDGDETNAWYSLKHLSAENDSVNASIQMHFPSVAEGMGFCEIVEDLYQAFLKERENHL
jgi:hypothetical protein